MSEDHQKARAAQVAKAIGILEREGDAAMEEYIFPLGVGWVKYYAARLEDALNALRAYQRAVEENRVFSAKFDPASGEFRNRFPFAGMAHAARQIVGFASDLENLFREHLNYDFDDAETETAEWDACQRQELGLGKERA